MNQEAFTQKIGIQFRDKNLLKQAFIHRSYLNENPDETLDHNERLEYLGDAVLELVVSEYLFRKFPEKKEGELTAIRAALVNTHSLSNAAGILGMDEYLFLSKGETKSEGRSRQYILANTFEAFVGALFLDQGIEAVKDFVARHLLTHLDVILKNNLWHDAKSSFQERAQEVTGITPTYRVLGERGPDHNKIFSIGVFLESECVATGEGYSKQEAEQDAAHRALRAKHWTEEK